MHRFRPLLRIFYLKHKTRIYTPTSCLWNLNTNSIQCRLHGTVYLEDGYIKKFTKSLEYFSIDKTRLKMAGYLLYENITPKIICEKWFEKLDLPDTFTSWFIVMELHVWMLSVRCMAEDLVAVSPTCEDFTYYLDGDGHIIRNGIIKAFWMDAENRIKLLEGANMTSARKQLQELFDHFRAAMLSFDEGLSDDKVLAGAIWRSFYARNPDADIENVETIVKYVRRQIYELDIKPIEEFKILKKFSWPNLGNI